MMRRIWIWSLLCVGLLSAGNVFAQLPRIVACPYFSMGMWGGDPDIWYAPYCDPDSGAMAMTLDPGASASDCPDGVNCVGGLMLEEGVTALPFPASVQKGYSDPMFKVEGPFAFQHGIRTTSMHDWVVSFPDNTGTTRYARVVLADVPNQVVKVPQAAFGPKPPFAVNAQNIVTIKAFTAKMAVEVSNEGVPPKAIIAAKAAKKPDAAWNVYQITFPRPTEADLTVDVLMHE
jgi:hypothetical protein